MSIMQVGHTISQVSIGHLGRARWKEHARASASQISICMFAVSECHSHPRRTAHPSPNLHSLLPSCLSITVSVRVTSFLIDSTWCVWCVVCGVCVCVCVGQTSTHSSLPPPLALIAPIPLSPRPPASHNCDESLLSFYLS